MKNMEEYDKYFFENQEFENILQYNSFSGSGLYDQAYLNARNNLIFSGEQYSSAAVGLTGIYSNNNEDWKEVGSQEIDVTDYLNPKKMYEMILDHPIIAVVQVILTIVSALGGIGMIFKISKLFSRYFNCSPTVLIMHNNRRTKTMRIKSRREKIQHSETESDIDSDIYSEDTDIGMELKKRVNYEPLSPYSS